MQPKLGNTLSVMVSFFIILHGHDATN